MQPHGEGESERENCLEVEKKTLKVTRVIGV